MKSTREIEKLSGYPSKSIQMLLLGKNISSGQLNDAKYAIWHHTTRTVHFSKNSAVLLEDIIYIHEISFPFSENSNFIIPSPIIKNNEEQSKIYQFQNKVINKINIIRQAHLAKPLRLDGMSHIIYALYILCVQIHCIHWRSIGPKRSQIHLIVYRQIKKLENCSSARQFHVFGTLIMEHSVNKHHF